MVLISLSIKMFITFQSQRFKVPGVEKLLEPYEIKKYSPRALVRSQDLCALGCAVNHKLNKRVWGIYALYAQTGRQSYL